MRRFFEKKAARRGGPAGFPEPRAPFFNYPPYSDGNAYLATPEAFKAKQRAHVQRWRKLEAEAIAIAKNKPDGAAEARVHLRSLHNAHFDWFMFPIDDGSRREFNVGSDADVQILRSDPEWLANYRESVRLVARAWGWDCEWGMGSDKAGTQLGLAGGESAGGGTATASEDSVDVATDQAQGGASTTTASQPAVSAQKQIGRRFLAGEAAGSWTDWDVRLAKIVRSLWMFEEEEYFHSMQNFARSVHEKEKGGESFFYGGICLDEMLAMELPRR